ncbi:hypothetical protein GcM1_02656 [Golovinomyces cichoracearum]|uniref:Secreted effector protein n=1 Tax=Golovinomyces cichoracearum TaxID=62708 RepID=A0A420ILG8_9PEZI|nr:hypothetical protein GcM1_02656 [Golovinomyces cichoracearum]
MKGSTLSSVLCTMAFSLGTSLASSSPLEKRNDDAVSVFDPPGLATRVLQCDKNFYTKMDTYATVGHALTSGNGKGRKRWCRSGMCVTFPALFSNKQILFRVQGPYDMFPVNPDGKQYMGVYNKEYVVAGVVKKGPLGYSKCLYNDRILPPRTPFMNRMRTKFNEITRNPFARKKQEDTTTTGPAKSSFSKLNSFAKNKQQEVRVGQQPQESQLVPNLLPIYEDAVGIENGFSMVGSRFRERYTNP